MRNTVRPLRVGKDEPFIKLFGVLSIQEKSLKMDMMR
jgi:hypothetical protein